MPPTPYIDHGWPADSWWGTTSPTTGPVGTASTWVGLQFTCLVAGRIAGFRRYDQGGYDGNQYAVLYDHVNNFICAAYRFKVWLPGGFDHWHNTWLRPWFRITPNQQYELFVMFAGGHYFRTTNGIGASGTTHGNISFDRCFQTTALFPFGSSLTLNQNANGVDILFYPDNH